MVIYFGAIDTIMTLSPPTGYNIQTYYYYDNDVLCIFKTVLNPIDIEFLSVQEGYSVTPLDF